MSVEYNWIKENVLSIGPYPDSKDLMDLKELGVKAVINLTEDSFNNDFIEENFLSLVWIPIPDFGVPSSTDLLTFVRYMSFFERVGIPVFIYCQGGRGRSGTLSAIYLMMNGLTAEEAINEVRKIREGTIETDLQERFIYFSGEFLPAIMDKKDQAFFNAKKIIEILREKCPWDRSQTHETLIKSLLDEAYEVVEAIRESDNAELKEELGDLLIQPFIQAQIEEESGNFTIYDSIEIMIDKLVRRHPHVFGDKVVNTPSAVMNQWTQIKMTENNNKQEGLIDEAIKISTEASSYGFDWDNSYDIFKKFEEELSEIGNAIKGSNLREIEEELGDAFFALFNIARFLKIDSIKAIERGRRKFEQRFRLVQKLLETDGKNPKDLSQEELDSYWRRAKTTIEGG